MTEKRYTHNILGSVFKDGKLFALTQGESQATTLCIELNALHEENEQLKHFIQKLTTKGTAKIHLANGSIYNVNAILTDFKGDFE